MTSERISHAFVCGAAGFGLGLILYWALKIGPFIFPYDVPVFLTLLMALVGYFFGDTFYDVLQSCLSWFWWW